MLTRIAAASGLALTVAAGSLALLAPPASAADVGSATLTEACTDGTVPSNHVLVDESFSGLGPSQSYHVELERVGGSYGQGGELGWVPDDAGSHVARANIEVTGTDPIVRAGQTFHWVLLQSPYDGLVGEGDAVVQAGTCASPGNPVPAVPYTTVTASKIKAAKHKATFAFTGTAATGFQCRLKKAHHAASYDSCTSPKVYKHLSGGKYKFFVRAVGPGGTDGSPAKIPFKI
jgi:hypothetical protein